MLSPPTHPPLANKVVGYLPWHDNQDELISNYLFLPSAEKTNKAIR